MLLRSFLVSLSLWVVYIAGILVPFKQLALPVYVVLFSFLYFPLICGLFQNKLSYGFGKYYLNFVKIGFSFCLLSIISGIVFILPFSFMSFYAYTIMRIVSGFAGGIGITCWFFLMTRWICLPIFGNLPLVKAYSMSNLAAKGTHTKLFLIIIRTYILCLLIIPAPWALKSYVRDIKNICKSRNKSLRGAV